MDAEYQRLSKTWTDLNREYRYELLTSDSATTYVQDHFKSEPRIVETFERLYDNILRADMIRYLTLLAEGGVYSDMDTDCTRPVRDWVPYHLLNRTNVVFGIEFDARGSEVQADMSTSAQICQWTLMSKPNHPVIRYIVDAALDKLEELGANTAKIVAHTTDDVLDSTGPHVFTKSVLEALSSQMGRPVDYRDLSNIDEPRLLGDVLIMPISSFASGQEHPASGAWGNDQQLISHHWKGFQGWKTHYPS
ncbi:glycosyltransferase family 32 protein [Dothistroma septosporum NZE10]|uniref:Glycosyltransferase family 32 protein n=1 Tax=Dothistroma septosporum (strain NZE10 / CBS 128990) TaxID=675120 RepID=N1PD33_DOTSN|nr:glycosyltransferase family 32 protein [Dothistroma septosporum NZE10]